MTERDEIILLIQDEEFRLKKSLLCEHSDYFRAMFSGHYVENEQQQICIDVVDAISMRTIIQYMEDGLLDLFIYPLHEMSDLAMAANFLQMTELMKQIEYTLELRTNTANWLKIMNIAENTSYTKLEKYSAAFGLLSFGHIELECIKSTEKLYWYLSHPYLHTSNELKVFEFGLQWALFRETGGDSFMLVLCCLDMKRLTTPDLIEMKKLLEPFDVSLAAKVVDCLHEVFSTNEEHTTLVVTKDRNKLCEMFTERVYTEVFNLIRDSKSRNLNFTAAVPFWIKTAKDEKKVKKITPPHHYMYTFSEQSGFECWLDVAEKNLWGWGVTTWGAMKLVVVCGEHGRGTGLFMRDVKVFDVLRNEWMCHGVQLPAGRHAGLTVVGDSLFIVGGVGAFRVILDKAIIYNLKERSYRDIAKFHDAIQNPAVCSHNNQVYAAGLEAIYRYDEHRDRWLSIVRTNLRLSCMTSFRGYIYCTQSYFSNLYRFCPDVDPQLEIIANFTNPPATICNLGNKLLFFTRSVCGQADVLSVEEYSGPPGEEQIKVIWRDEHSDLVINDVSGCCSLVIYTPPHNREIPECHEHYLQRCSNML